MLLNRPKGDRIMSVLLYGYLNIMNWFTDEEGQDLVEYALLLGLIALAAVAILIVVGGNVETIWQRVSDALATATLATGP